MMALNTLTLRVRPLVERVDQMSLRERALVFAAGVALLYCLWQTLLMDPLLKQSRAAQQRLTTANQNTQVVDQANNTALQDPAIAAAARNRALTQRLATLDADLAKLAQGYVSPQRMTHMLREVIATQQGLRLVSLVNLPVLSLSDATQSPPTQSVSAVLPPADSPRIAPEDRGPFLHPVEIIVDGSYVAIVNYLHALEKLSYRIQWQRLELTTQSYPNNRVRIVIGALSLSRQWISV